MRASSSGLEGPRRQVGLALVAAALGGAGALVSREPVALFAWLALAAPAIGALAGGLGMRLWPAGWLAPGAWTLVVVLVELDAARPLPRGSLGLAVIAGLYFLGLALGSRWRRAPEGLAGALLLVAMALATGATVVNGGASGGAGAPITSRAPGVGRALLDASPIVLVLESAGLDWTHAHPVVYAHGGVEWVPRAPYRGALAGPVLLLLGSLSACLAQRRAGTRSAGS